jgi:GMP synthase (glutamine-hydrolysing)
MTDKILILDFGSQYTQLIARRIRELEVYCEIIPCNKNIDWSADIKGIILSGSPCSVNDNEAPTVDIAALVAKVPVLGVCYGAQLIAKQMGGSVNKSNKREYGKANLRCAIADFNYLDTSVTWMSHADSIANLGNMFTVIAHTDHIPIAFFQSNEDAFANPMWGVQFHPEVTHSQQGLVFLNHFINQVCKCQPNWTALSFIDESVNSLKNVLQQDKVLLALSGGVDSSVAAVLLHKAIGHQLHCVFVDNGLLRKNEYQQVLDAYNGMGLNVIGVNAAALFLDSLADISDPEQKRKIIGKTFIDVFEQEAKKLNDVKWLAQGTIYPDVVESVSVHGGPSQTIKSHHNVGGLPDKLNLKIIEPLRLLFKDEVRRVGKALAIDDKIVSRHPFPGPGLAIRIMGSIDIHKVELLQKADDIYISILKKHNWYNKIWQAGAILTNVKTVGVMGDERTYEHVLALRAVSSVDGMTAEWVHLPYDILAEISNSIINEVKGINRVVYDISTKPPATIEWE